MKRILLFASGTGSNVENIIQYFKKNNAVAIVGVFSNNPEAKVLEKAKDQNINSLVFNRTELNDGVVLKAIEKLHPDLIVLAGFLWKMPEKIVHQYYNKIINIHPALLPKHGGKGMYGSKVHQAVFENKEPATGITIHYVNEIYNHSLVDIQNIQNHF